ncbi:peptidoglycan-associated lipoprotein Pal [Brevundimonas sp. SORGH_AS_0993]|uniref:peptidoglycan-associated lipoprotein Pal n=1 Tax=Brevundimonas sp. SORGH_AS_0993 TaxID=3041794 RepID=UPI002782BC8C|nr:peptidoglycan-associated lipoprotein Pal [Brevundimonas sp. SORGH_AS_0993]MDQ1154404.1 peptidoglycan-associated lipoprotein [Brevundimonas sp. SORGH_AS_0993]
MKKSRILTVAMVGCAVAAMAACTRKPPVDSGVTDTGATTPTGPSYPTVPTAPITGGQVGAAQPGSEQDFVVNIGDRIYFDLDSIEVRPEAMPRLDAQAQWLLRYPQVTVRIEGNADERGTREYNLALGARRAEAVRNYLINRGVPAGRIDTISFGKERPIAEGSNEDAWARNRNAHTAIVSGAPR